MLNNYQPQPIKLIKITPQATGIKLFRFEFLDRDFGKNFKFSPGQFIQLSIPGFGEGPFAPCGDSNEKYIELCVRNAGRLTEKIHSLKIGGKAAIRGPYGNGWILPCHCEESATKQSSRACVEISGLLRLARNDRTQGKNHGFQIALHGDDDM